MTEEKEYRCTRQAPYDAVGCPGHSSSSSRQGHYVFADSAMAAAMKMFVDYPEEAFHGFTIQLKDNKSAMFTWTISQGLRLLEEAERLRLPDLFVAMSGYTTERDPMRLAKDLQVALAKPDDMKVTLAAHRHRHGVSLLAYRAKRELSEEEIIEMLGEDFEEGRDDEYIDDICSTTFAEIQFIEVE